MRQLEPGTGKCIRKLLRMLVETPRNLFVSRVVAQGQIRGQHGRSATPGGIEWVRHGVDACVALWLPLVRAGRTLSQLPFIFEQGLEIIIAPLCRFGGPDDFQATGDRVRAVTISIAALPTEPLVFYAGRLRIRPNMRRGSCAMRFTEGVAACN